MSAMKIKARVVNHALEAAQEASTWRGVVVLASLASGYAFTNAELEQLALAGVAISAAMKVLFRDRRKV